MERNSELEIVVDNNTSLIWQDDNDTKNIRKNWLESISYCENLNIGTYNDWRLPNKNELSSIVDHSRYAPSINTAVFKNVISDSSSYYWSSTSDFNDSNNAWIVGFSFGNFIVPSAKDTIKYVRCVRNH